MGNKRASDEISEPMADSEIPPEFRKLDKPFGLEEHKFNWILGLVSHSLGFYALLYLILMGIIKPSTFLIAIVPFGYIAGFGINLGAHRYWTHRSFKANRKLEVLLMLLHTATFQMPIFHWSRSHRVHHKYSETEADPHDARKGFWHSHALWLLKPKHPEYEKKLKTIDFSDLARDPVLKFQAKYYWELVLVCFFILPMTLIHLTQPDLTFIQLLAANFQRHVVTSHFTFSINSLSHIWGNKPYDKYIGATQNRLVSIIAYSEGNHNYHHAFPWDYRPRESGLHPGIIFLHFFAWLGWAYDLKTVSQKHLLQRIKRTGDGSHSLHGKEIDTREEHFEPCSVWGWGDKELQKKDLEIAETVFPKVATD